MGAGSLMDEETQLAGKEYGEVYGLLKFPTPDESCRAEEEREEILASLSGRVIVGFCGTKLDCRDLSPGCRLCGEGVWSCLFINNICNARCFYCPVEQPSRAEPMTGGIRFPNPQEYTAYLEKLQIEGVGISGGEPLLTFERTLRFATAVKKRFGDRIHLWLYTNGIALTPEKVEGLREAGLDEIRFDISADQYRLDKVGLSAGVIPAVTVEIPAISEDCETLRRSLPELERMGVAHLNLRQLRCTPHNALNLVKRGYTFLRGSKVTVLDSELAALRTLRYARDSGIGLPVHYCSFAFRDRFQAVGQRKRLAGFVKMPFEDITALGYIRRISLRGEPSDIGRVADRLRQSEPATGLWEADKENRRLSFTCSHLGISRPSACTLSVSYWEPVLLPEVSYHSAFVELRLSRKRAVFVERRRVVKDREVVGEEADALHGLLGAMADGSPRIWHQGLDFPLDGPSGHRLRAIRDIGRYEVPDFGLQPYA